MKRWYHFRYTLHLDNGMHLMQVYSKPYGLLISGNAWFHFLSNLRCVQNLISQGFTILKDRTLMSLFFIKFQAIHDLISCPVSNACKASSLKTSRYWKVRHINVAVQYYSLLIRENCYSRTPNMWLRYYRIPNVDFAKTTSKTLTLCFQWYYVLLIVFLISNTCILPWLDHFAFRTS
jgi:hypothetical protein